MCRQSLQFLQGKQGKGHKTSMGNTGKAEQTFDIRLYQGTQVPIEHRGQRNDGKKSNEEITPSRRNHFA